MRRIKGMQYFLNHIFGDGCYMDAWPFELCSFLTDENVGNGGQPSNIFMCNEFICNLFFVLGL